MNNDQPIASLSFEEKKARVSTLLRHVDTEMKAGNLDKALELTKEVYRYDSKNLYARALEERIVSMKSETARLKLQKEAQAKAAESVKVEAAVLPFPGVTVQQQTQIRMQVRSQTELLEGNHPILPYSLHIH